jgi:ATP-dependent Lon protease
MSDSVKRGLEIIPVSRIDEVLGHALTRKPVPIVWDEASAKPTVETPVEEESSARTVRGLLSLQREAYTIRMR